MIRRLAAVLALFSIFAAPATFALETPKGTSSDARVKRIAYNEDDVVAVYAYQGIATHVVFGADESILDMASGFSDGWEFKAVRNHLYLKPKSLEAHGTDTTSLAPQPGRWDTNLAVTTNKRVYTFQLFLIGPRNPAAKLEYDPRMAFQISFSYPKDEARAAQTAAQAREVKQRLAQRSTYRNTSYTMQVGKKSDAIKPAEAWDDGTFTYFRFPANREVPAIFLVGADKSESLVNAHVEGDRMVIQRVAPEYVFRLGKQVVSVFNESYDPDGRAPQDGTTVDGVKRVVLGQEAE